MLLVKLLKKFQVIENSDLKCGVVWGVGTSLVDDYPIVFYKMAKKVVKHYSSNFDCLFNRIDASNRKSISFVKHSGFSLSDHLYSEGCDHGQFYRWFSLCVSRH